MICYNDFTFQKIWHLAKGSVMITTGNAARRREYLVVMHLYLPHTRRRIMKNELARTLFFAGTKVQYDAQCKKVLSHKVILAWILKYTMEEFREYSIEKIVVCIEAEPEISSVRVNPGCCAAERISGSKEESKEPGEGEIYYDIRFFVYVPKKGKRLRMLINVEAQRSFYCGYEIVTRGIFYASRMISEQLGTEFSIPDYNGIKKVCSIWLCMNAPGYIGNTLTEYSIAKRDVAGWQPDKPGAYSKIMICIVTLNEKLGTDSVFLEMLNVLLSGKKSYKEKERLLREKFHIKMDADMRREINLMCNLSEAVYENGRKSGIKHGVKRGIRRGRQAEKRRTARAMLEGRYPEEEILRLVEMTSGELESVKREMETT